MKEKAAAGGLTKKQMGLWGEIFKAPVRKLTRDTHVIKRTVRSGQRIEKRGNVVIIGDINPGAQVIASGDIIVFGKIRGVVHAGAEGDETARILAWELRPTQLRIAGFISRSPDSWENWSGPEVARVVDRVIIVESFR